MGHGSWVMLALTWHGRPNHSPQLIWRKQRRYLTSTYIPMLQDGFIAVKKSLLKFRVVASCAILFFMMIHPITLNLPSRLISTAQAEARRKKRPVEDILMDWLDQGASGLPEPALSAKQALENQAVIRLIESWLAEDPEYDEQVWPVLKQAIEENRLSDRPRFAE